MQTSSKWQSLDWELAAEYSETFKYDLKKVMQKLDSSSSDSQKSAWEFIGDWLDTGIYEMCQVEAIPLFLRTLRELVPKRQELLRVTLQFLKLINKYLDEFSKLQTYYLGPRRNFESRVLKEINLFGEVFIAFLKESLLNEDKSLESFASQGLTLITEFDDVGEIVHLLELEYDQTTKANLLRCLANQAIQNDSSLERIVQRFIESGDLDLNLESRYYLLVQRRLREPTSHLEFIASHCFDDIKSDSRTITDSSGQRARDLVKLLGVPAVKTLISIWKDQYPKFDTEQMIHSVDALLEVVLPRLLCSWHTREDLDVFSCPVVRCIAEADSFWSDVKLKHINRKSTLELYSLPADRESLRALVEKTKHLYGDHPLWQD